MLGKWHYEGQPQFAWGDEQTYQKGIAFLDGHGAIEDWGCGTAYARRFVSRSRYIGIDGSPSGWADRVVDLRTYTSNTDCIFMRHVLEHNFDWQPILRNAIQSFRRRMVLVIFTPFADETRQIATAWDDIPDLSFRKTDLTAFLTGCRYTEESLPTRTLYGQEHVFYLQKDA